MQRTDVNPWTWQEKFGFSQCVDVRAPERLVELAGQGPVDADGNLVFEGDVDGQIRQTMENLETVLTAAGLQLSDVVRLTIFTTDMDAFFAAYGTFAGRLAAGGCVPASSLIGVARLAIPGMTVEMEATAAA
jgi:enamine deaminase RidA (YjgF/YER057c/UK114 family)